MRILCAPLLILIFLTSCVSGSGTENPAKAHVDLSFPPITSGSWYKPPVEVTWHWQLSGSVNITYDVELYDIDLFDAPVTLIQQLHNAGKKVICYFSAGSYETWRPDAAQFDESDLGKTLDGWPDERWLDIRSPDIQTIMETRLDLAVQKGCDGVEPDNMDGYANRSGFDLTDEDQFAFNRFIANAAHTRGLSVGLKNDLDQIPDLIAYFDFAVNEQCFEYAECDALAPFIAQGKAVLNVEYKPAYMNNATERQRLCFEANERRFSTLILPLELDDAFRLTCF